MPSQISPSTTASITISESCASNHLIAVAKACFSLFADQIGGGQIDHSAKRADGKTEVRSLRSGSTHQSLYWATPQDIAQTLHWLLAGGRSHHSHTIFSLACAFDFATLTRLQSIDLTKNLWNFDLTILGYKRRRSGKLDFGFWIVNICLRHIWHPL